MAAALPISFNDAFWSEEDNNFDGFTRLSKRMKDAKHMYDELADYLQKRIKIELQYGKDIAALGKTVKPCSDSGSSAAAWQVVKDQTVAVGNVHTGFAEELRSNVAQPLETLRENMRAERKNVEDSVTSAQKKKVSATDNVSKKEKKYHQCCRDSDKAKKDVNDAKGVGASIKEIDKLSQKARKAQEALATAQEQYKDAVKLLDDARRQWEHEMQKCCKTYYRMETQRLTQQRSMIWLTANIVSATAVESDAKQEEIRKALETVDVEGDLTEFINKNKIGGKRPAPIMYRDYYDNSPSQFTRPVSKLISASNDRPASAFVSPVTRAVPAARPRSVMPTSPPVTSAKSPESSSQWYKAAYDYMPQGPAELQLAVGDKIFVLEKTEADWWKGKKQDGRTGMCPSSYLKPV